MASDVNSKFCHASKMELFAKIVKNEKPFTVFAETSTGWPAKTYFIFPCFFKELPGIFSIFPDIF